MRTIHRSRTSNYELVYSTSRNVNAGSRDGNAGDRPARRSGGSRRGGAGSDKRDMNNLFFNQQREQEGEFTPADVIKRQQDIRKRGEDKRRSGEDKGGESD